MLGLSVGHLSPACPEHAQPVRVRPVHRGVTRRDAPRDLAAQRAAFRPRPLGAVGVSRQARGSQPGRERGARIRRARLAARWIVGRSRSASKHFESHPGREIPPDAAPAVSRSREARARAAPARTVASPGTGWAEPCDLTGEVHIPPEAPRFRSESRQRTRAALTLRAPLVSPTPAALSDIGSHRLRSYPSGMASTLGVGQRALVEPETARPIRDAACGLRSSDENALGTTRPQKIERR